MTTNSSRPDPLKRVYGIDVAPDGPPALLDPEPTADKRVRLYNEALRRRGPQPRMVERVIPGLDVADLERRYHTGDPANVTQSIIGTFKVPMGIGWPTWERLRNAAAARFLGMLERDGWVVARITARPGVYPYRDVLTGTDDPAFREMQLVAVGGYPKAERVVVELDPEDVEPIVQRSGTGHVQETGQAGA